jgi:HlyD family type I secretion membrane fusion protein
MEATMRWPEQPGWLRRLRAKLFPPVRRELVRISEQAQYFTGHRNLDDYPAVARALTRVDTVTRFLTERDYADPNPAIAATRRPMVVGLWIMLVLAGITLMWGALAPIDSAVVARGSVALLSNKKTVQHLEGGVIDEILVHEGETVKQGQPLVRLNAASAKANAEIQQKDLWTARAVEARLLAERDGLDTVTFDPALVKAAENNPDLAQALETQSRLFDVQRRSQEAKGQTLEQRIAQAKEQIEGFKAQIAAADGQVALLDREIGSVEKLLKKGYATLPRLLALQRTREELRGNRGQYQAQIAQAEQSIAETQAQIVDLQNEFATKNAQDLKDTQTTIAETEQKLNAAQDVRGRTLITAPVAGIVTGLKYHTIGGVIQPGTPILDIIPQNDQLIIEAHVQPNDIEVVHAGLDAKVLLTAYKMRTTPKLPGKVIMVSADKFVDEHAAQPSSYYIAQVEVDPRALRQLKHPPTLYPGMPADVLIRTGSRSFLAYLFQPITDSATRAFREE